MAMRPSTWRGAGAHRGSSGPGRRGTGTGAAQAREPRHRQRPGLPQGRCAQGRQRRRARRASRCLGTAESEGGEGCGERRGGLMGRGWGVRSPSLCCPTPCSPALAKWRCDVVERRVEKQHGISPDTLRRAKPQPGRRAERVWLQLQHTQSKQQSLLAQPVRMSPPQGQGRRCARGPCPQSPH